MGHSPRGWGVAWQTHYHQEAVPKWQPVLLVNAAYKFLWIELDRKGHMSDALIFGDLELFSGLEEGPLGLLQQKSRDDRQDMPFFILGDDALVFRNYHKAEKHVQREEDIR